MATKVFVGNLSFKILPDKLREEFSVAGNVLSANIITRGPRSLGYGFVEFASREDAQKSVDLMNHKDIDGREINVEIANPRADPPVRQPPAEKRAQQQSDEENQGGQRPPKRTRRPRNNNQNAAAGPNGQAGPGPRGGRGGPQQSEQPKRMTYRPRNQNNQEGGAGGAGPATAGGAEGHGGRNQGNNTNNTTTTTTTTNHNQDGADTRPFRRRRRNPNRGQRQEQQLPPQQPLQQQQPQQPQQPQQQFRRKRPAPAQPRKQQEKTKSPTTLFVANLPFAVEDKELAEIFSGKWKVVKAHVVKKRNARSKGFGFVEFDNEADQQAALKEFDGFVLHERPLSIKVALTAVPEKDVPAEGGASTAEPAAQDDGEKGVEKGAAAETNTEAKEVKADAAGSDDKKGGQ